jgi:hypothetical protein
MLVGRKFGMDAATLLAVLNASSGHVVEFCGRRPGTGSRSHRGGALPRTGRRRLAHRDINMPMSAAILRTAVVRLEVAPAENTTGNESPNGSSAPHPRVDLFGAPLEVSVFAAADRHEGGHGDVRIAINVGGLGRRAAVHIGSPRGPRREVLSEQPAPSGLTRASAKLADVRAVIAACWADGSVEAAERAVAVATAAQDAVAHQATTICGEIDLAQLHPMRAVVPDLL